MTIDAGLKPEGAPEQAQPGVSKPCRTTIAGGDGLRHEADNDEAALVAAIAEAGLKS